MLLDKLKIIAICMVVFNGTAIDGYPMKGSLLNGGYTEYNLSKEIHQINTYIEYKTNDPKIDFRSQRVLDSKLFYGQSDKSKNYNDPSKSWHVMYDYNTKEAKVIPKSDWYFSDKQWLIYHKISFNDDALYKHFDKKITKGRFEHSYWIYELESGVRRQVLPTDNNALEGLDPIDPSYSYTGSYIYYINKKGELIEKNAETSEEVVRSELLTFFRDHPDALYFKLSPPSPDRKYIAIQAESELYLIDLETKTIQHIAGKTFGFLGRGVEGPLYWDKDSKYLLFGANFDWLAWFYDHDVYYYDVEKKSTHRIDTGDRLNGNFWYSWE